MKFEYDGNTDERECVAFIDGDGDLWISVESELFGELKSIVFFTNTGETNVGSVSIQEGMGDCDVIKKFYPGDKITITF